MKALIMAGGEGVRLRPLTCTVPKPMVKISGKPVIEYTFDLLIKHGFDEAVVTLGYLPDEIKNAYENGYKSLSLEFVTEDEPLGTAGSVKNALKDNKDSVLIISGDAVCNFDLSGIIKYHKVNSGAVSVVGKRVNAPGEYGVINVGEHNRIVNFTEKPGWSQAVSNIANSGVYLIEPEVLNMIPDNEKFDFANDLFPLLLKNNIPMFCYVSEDYWCDIGSIESYLSCQIDALDGKFATPEIDIYDHSDFTAIPPVYIGKNVDISRGAVIGPYSSIGDNSSVASGAKIRYSSVDSNAVIEENVSLNGSLICSGAKIKKGSAIYENSVVGSGAVVGSGVTVKPNIKIWPNKVIPKNSVVSENVKYGFVKHFYVSGEGIDSSSSEHIDVETCLRLGRALGSSAYIEKTAVATDGSFSAQAMSKALSAGVLSAGGKVWDIGTAFKTQINFFVNLFDLDCGVFISGNKKREIYICAEGGLPLPRYLERSIEAAMKNSSFAEASDEYSGEYNVINSLRNLYNNSLSEQAENISDEISVEFKCDNPLISYTVENVINKSEVNNNSEITFLIDSDAKNLRAVTSKSEIDHYTLLAIACYDDMKKGKDISIPYDAPEYIDELGQKCGVNVYRYLSSPSDDSDHKARKLASKQFYLRDALFLAVKILAIINERGATIDELVSMLPQKYVSRETVEIDYLPSSVCDALDGCMLVFNKESEGVKVDDKKGKLRVIPDRTGEKLKVIAQADTMEAATELCAEIVQKLKNYKNINNTLT